MKWWISILFFSTCYWIYHSLLPIFPPASCFPCTTVSLKRCLNLKLASKKILRLKTHESEIMLCTRVCYACSPITLKWWWACNDLGFCRGIFSIMNKLWVGMRPPPYRQGEVEGPSQKEYFYNGETRWGHYDSETVWGRPNWFLQRQKRWKRLLSSHFPTMAEPFISKLWGGKWKWV